MANINVLFVIGVVVQRVLHHEQFKPQMVGDLLRIHMMKLLQTRDSHHHNTRAFNTGPTAANQRMRGDARRQLVKLDTFDMLANVGLLALYLFIDALLRHCIVLHLPSIAPAAQ